VYLKVNVSVKKSWKKFADECTLCVHVMLMLFTWCMKCVIYVAGIHNVEHVSTCCENVDSDFVHSVTHSVFACVCMLVVLIITLYSGLPLSRQKNPCVGRTKLQTTYQTFSDAKYASYDFWVACQQLTVKLEMFSIRFSKTVPSKHLFRLHFYATNILFQACCQDFTIKFPDLLHCP